MVKIRSHRFYRWALPAFVIVLIVAGSAIALNARSVHKAQHTSGTVPTSKKNTSSANSKASKGSAKSDSGSSSSSTKAQGSAITNSAALVAPFGTFISNHKPGQNGSPTSEQSVCNTTPGATCDIQFTKSGVTKNLGAQVADSSGTAYWSWDIRGGTLAPGTWQVTAVVKLNGQVKTTPDPTPLEVQ